MNIQEGSIWMYVGPMPGKDIPHCVTSNEKDDITTWSSFDKNPTNGGYSWRGNSNQFLKNFKPLQLV